MESIAEPPLMVRELVSACPTCPALPGPHSLRPPAATWESEGPGHRPAFGALSLTILDVPDEWAGEVRGAPGPSLGSSWCGGPGMGVTVRPPSPWGALLAVSL